MSIPVRFPPSSRFALLGALLTISACGLAAGNASTSPRDSTCRAVHGTIVPACNGTICSQGKLTGDLSGRFRSKITSIYPGGSGWVFTAWTRIELDNGNGRIETIDRGTAFFDSKGGPDLSRTTEVLSINDASGTYRDDSGTLVISGAHQVGRVEPYSGELCMPLAQ